MSRVKRKPPPTFPYSPRYPLPDPTDPFTPLRTLRERASSNNASLQFSLDDSSNGNLTLDGGEFLLSLNSDTHGQGLDIYYPPSSTDHHEPLAPPNVWQDRIGGYHSDNTLSRRPRPPRSRVKPDRESRIYFSDVDHPASPPNLIYREQNQHQLEKTGDSPFQHRRRSRSAYILRSPGQDQDQPPVADIATKNASADAFTLSHPEPEEDESRKLVGASYHAEPQQDVTQMRQYTYDDRQSHGYLFSEPGSVSDMHDSPSVDTLPTVRSHRSPTPSMTPDDTISMSGSSARDRSVSMSPTSLLRDLPPRAVSMPILDAMRSQVGEVKDFIEEQTSASAPTPGAEFPTFAVRTSTAPSSPALAPVMPPSNLSHNDPGPVEVPDTDDKASTRGRTESTGKRQSVNYRLRRTSSAESGRWRKRSDPGHRPASSKASTGSESSLSAALAAVQALVDVPRSSLSASAAKSVQPTVSGGPSAFPGLYVRAQSSTRPLQPHSKVQIVPDGSDDGGAESDPGPSSKTTRLILHKPKKSLSHVSLVLAGLPNISMGPTIPPSANTSIGSAMTVGAGFGSVGSMSREDLTKATHEFALLRPPVVHHEVQQPAKEEAQKPKITERSVKRLSSFPVLDEDSLNAEIKREMEETSPLGTSTPAFTALTRFDRPRTPIPLTPITSCAPSAADYNQGTHAQALQRGPTPPPIHSYTSPLPQIPAPIPREPPPDNHRQTFLRTPLPPQINSTPEFYISPIPVSPPTEIAAPAPLPLSPPQPSEPPTPLPVPTPRAKSPPPQLPSRPREALHTVPAVVRSDTSLTEDDPPVRSRSPPTERKHRRRGTAREEERQSVYLPVAQLRPQAQAQVQTEAPREPDPEPKPQFADQTLSRKRISTAQIVAPVRQPTPPTQVPTRTQGRPTFLASASTHRSQTPPAEAPRRPTTPHGHAPPRAQSPPAVPDFRPQPPPAGSTSRTRGTPAPSRAQSPSARAPSRARSPTSSQEQSYNRGRNQDQSFAQLSRAGTAQSAGTQSSTQHTQTRHHGTAPSTPVPQTTTPSPTMTTYSQPHQQTRAERRPRTRAPLPHRSHRYQPRQQPSLTNLRFDEYAIPARDQLRHAASMYVVAQNGIRVQFGELFRDRKTVVCFLRHFWCPADQDYMYSVARSISPDALERAGIGLVFIGLGSPAMIKSYKQIFRMPYSIYTDPTLRLHAALGMTRRSSDPGSDTERGDYVRHGSLGGLAMVVKNAIRVGMPVWERGGDVTQLGGEFVVGPGLSCTYAHRMRTTRSHAPMVHVLEAAGVRTPSDEETWMEDRRHSYARMQAKREKRREGAGAGEKWRGDESGDMSYGSDTGSASLHGYWGTEATRAETGVLRSYEQRETKRPVRSFHVANPDQHQYLPPTPIDEDGTAGDHGWDADVSDLPYLEGIGRMRDESYGLTHEVLTYPFGQA